MEKLRIICRKSKLSLIQAGIVAQRIQQEFPNIKIEIKGRTSRGDREIDVPLHTLSDTDFFAKEIYQALENGEADVAVHSLKDVSGDHFFGGHYFAVVDRDDVRDVAIFNANVMAKCRMGESIRIGTSSPRREHMALNFLQKALPFFNMHIDVKAVSIRGNVETRLHKLDAGEYDGIILAAAGLNRLLKYGNEENRNEVQNLLRNKRLMLLPITACVPAPAQGAIVAEALNFSPVVVSILQKIRQQAHHENCVQEKLSAREYGSGCMQRFGVATITTVYGTFTYAAGLNKEEQAFTHWQGLPAPLHKAVYTGLLEPTGLFTYIAAIQNDEDIQSPSAVYIAHKHVLDFLPDEQVLDNKNIYAAGVYTWYALAQKGYWVTACADGLGVEMFITSMRMPLFNIVADDVVILTNTASAMRWLSNGRRAVGIYTTVPTIQDSIVEFLKKAEAVFWYSYNQYETLAHFTKPGCTYLCLAGETATRILASGHNPIVFSSKQAFLQWLKNTI